MGVESTETPAPPERLASLNAAATIEPPPTEVTEHFALRYVRSGCSAKETLPGSFFANRSYRLVAGVTGRVVVVVVVVVVVGVGVPSSLQGNPDSG
jgi:hypothetical protein